MQATEGHVTNNVETKKAFQSYIGKLNHIAGIVEMLRPFLSDLYGVLHQTVGAKAPPNCFWAKQWSHVTQWIRAFFNKAEGEICRVYRMKAWLPVAIVTDALLWGIVATSWSTTPSWLTSAAR